MFAYCYTAHTFNTTILEWNGYFPLKAVAYNFMAGIFKFVTYYQLQNMRILELEGYI